jgi:hypothetical protein
MEQKNHKNNVFNQMERKIMERKIMEIVNDKYTIYIYFLEYH